MTNIATALKTEITRLSKKALKQDIAALRSANALQRKQIAGLRVQLTEVQRAFAQLQKSQPTKVTTADEEAGGTARFSGKGLKSHREKLQLSAEAYGRLIGVSALSIYKWESGKIRPRQKQVHALAAVRGMGKREAKIRLTKLDYT